jgi:MFS family permease
MIDIKILKKINLNVYYIGLVGFFMNFAATLVYTTLLIFVGGSNNILNQNTIILVRTLSEALANFAKIFSGFISDRLQNRKSFLVIGYSAMLFAKLGFLLLTFRDFFPLIFLQCLYIVNQIFDRCMNAIRDPARDAILMESSTPETRGVCFGIRKLITSFGSIVGGLITGLLILMWQRGYTNVIIYKYAILPPLVLMICLISYILRKRILLFLFGFLFLGLGLLARNLKFSSLLYMVSILPVIFSILVVTTKIKEPKKTTIKTRDIINLSLLKNNMDKFKSIFILLIIMCLLSLGKLSEYCIFAIGMEMGFSKYWIPFMFTIVYIAITISSYIFGLLIDKKKHFFTLLLSILSLLISSLLFFFYGINGSLIMFWMALILNSIFFAASDSAFASIITFYMPSEDMKATIYGLIYGLSGFMTLLNACLVAYLQNSGYTLCKIYGFAMVPVILAFSLLLRTKSQNSFFKFNFHDKR